MSNKTTAQQIITATEQAAQTVEQLNKEKPHRPYDVGGYNSDTGNTRIAANIGGRPVIV